MTLRNVEREGSVELQGDSSAARQDPVTVLASLGSAVRFAQKWEEYLRGEALPALNGIVIPKVDEAKQLLDSGFFSASVVASYTALEVALLTAIVRPFVLAGSLSPELAELVAERVLRSSGQELRRVTREVTGLLGIDLPTTKGPKGESIWDEIANDLAPLRNRIVHEGVTATRADAESAQRLAANIVHDVVLPIFGSIGLAPDQHPDWSARQALMERVGRIAMGQVNTTGRSRRK